MALPSGGRAPEFTLKTIGPEGLVDVRLSDNFGQRPTVLLFFPGAFTKPCTEEFCAFTAGLSEIPGAAVYGISADTPFAQAAWAKQEGIAVTLLSDYRREVIAAYDVVLPDLAGLGPSAARAAFVIDRDGVIRYSEQTPTPGELPDLAAVRQAVAAL